MNQPVEEQFDYQFGKLPISVFFTDVDEEHPVPSHWHDGMEIFLVLSGSGEVKIDLISHFIRAGDTVVVPPGSIHSVTSEESTGMHCKAIIFNLNLLGGNPEDPVCRQYIDPVLTKKISFVSVLSGNSLFLETLRQEIVQAVDHFAEKAPFYELEVKSRLFRIYFLLFAEHCTVSSNEPPNQVIRNLWAVLEYISKNYSQPISVEELAAKAGYSKFYFLRIFKEHTGFTPVQYINQVRLDHAVKMLMQEKDSVTQISLAAGFENVSYFIRLFSQKYKMTPLRYRKKFLQG